MAEETHETSFSDDEKEDLELRDLNNAPETSATPSVASMRFDEEIPEKPKSSAELEAVYDVPVQVSAVLGKSSMLRNSSEK